MNTIIKYRVDIGYRKFDFSSGTEALSFAQTAAMTVAENERVEISIVYEMPKEAEEDAV